MKLLRPLAAATAACLLLTGCDGKNETAEPKQDAGSTAPPTTEQPLPYDFSLASGLVALTTSQANDLKVLAARTPVPKEPANSAEVPSYPTDTVSFLSEHRRWIPVGLGSTLVADGVGPFEISDGYCLRGYSPTVQGAIVFYFSMARMLSTPQAIDRCAREIVIGTQSSAWADKAVAAKPNLSSKLAQLAQKWPTGEVSNWNRDTAARYFKAEKVSQERVTLQIAMARPTSNTYSLSTQIFAYEGGTWKLQVDSMDDQSRVLVKLPDGMQTWTPE